MGYVTVDIEIEDVLEQVSDEELIAEYNERGLGSGGTAENWDEKAELEKVHKLHHAGRRDEAYEILWKMCLIKLNKVV